MTPRTSTYLRRLALATLFAGAATLSASAFGDPAVACAKPNDGSSVREWDIEKFDACMASNPMPPGERYCCDRSGGVTDYTTGKCKAPPAAAASQQPPPYFDGPMATLYMPPPPPPSTPAPAGQVGPPPGEAALAP